MTCTSDPQTGSSSLREGERCVAVHLIRPGRQEDDTHLPQQHAIVACTKQHPSRNSTWIGSATCCASLLWTATWSITSSIYAIAANVIYRTDGSIWDCTDLPKRIATLRLQAQMPSGAPPPGYNPDGTRSRGDGASNPGGDAFANS